MTGTTVRRGDGGARHGRRRPRWLRAGGRAALLAGTALLAAACGGGSSSGSTGSAAASSGQSDYQQMLAYSQCMRAHGAASFPDPAQGPGGAYAYPMRSLTGPGYDAAVKACQKVAPKGGGFTPAERQAAVNQLLKLSQCMRAHGIAGYPDPTVSQHLIGINVPASIDTSSPQFQAAQKACQAIAPGF